jgi:predicted AAA+ superfamily ATPase
MAGPSSKYLARIVDAQLSEYLETFGAVSVEGPKWCGKTTTCMQQSNTNIEITDPAGNYAIRTLARIDPAQLFHGEPPILLDEWQAASGIWDAVRHDVDLSHSRGKFLLCGSASPKKQVSHSGAGRIARLRMRTMTLFESGVSSGSVSLHELTAGGKAAGTTSAGTSLDEVIDAICRGGWPETINDPLERAMLVPRQYLESVCNPPYNDDDIERINPDRMRALLRAIARSVASPVRKITLIQDTDETYQPSSKRSVATSYETFNRYYEILRRLYLVEEQAAWAPALRSPIRLRTTPKLHLADPSLAVAALGATPQTLKSDFKTLGLLFESMAFRDLDVYAFSFGATVRHYIDNSDLESDAIVELPDGGWGAFEVKLSPDKIDMAAESLNKLETKMVEAKQEPPRCKCVIVGTFATAYTRPDGVAVVPLATLRP